MRSFIGINFSRAVKEDIIKIQSQVRDNAVKGRFKHADNFHITLKFLGEIEEHQAEELANVLQDIAGRHEPFSLKLKELGCFKGRQDIHTLYIGLGGDIKALQQLNADTETTAAALGFKRESRPYTPHITISQDLTLRLPFEKLKHDIDIRGTEPIQVNKIELIKSEQIQGKRIYTPIYGFELKKTNV